MNDVVHYEDLRVSIRKLTPTWSRKLAPIICLRGGLLRMAEWWIMRPSGPDSGLNRTTSNRGSRRNRMEPHGTPRSAKNGQLRTQIHLFFARFPYFCLLVFFFPLLHRPTHSVATIGNRFETTDMLVAGRWSRAGKRARMEEWRRNVLSSGPGSGRMAQRAIAEPRGTLKSSDYALRSIILSRVSHIFAFSFSSRLPSPIARWCDKWKAFRNRRHVTC